MLMSEPNQIDRGRSVSVASKVLQEVPVGPITEEDLRTNVSLGIQYIEAWLRGSGEVPIFNLMEDAATAEISRAHVWQWIRHERGVLSDGRNIDFDLVRTIIDEEHSKLLETTEQNASDHAYETAAGLLWDLILENEFVEFLTVPGYKLLV
ncbi:aldolase/citrate lyase/malate synthase family protein [Alicyclobacillus dauci]|uniref:Malate synthase C-terminal domain-containing protein n=1 Tax=Alicyclobacillus dauci TaxID=1475485 RepID=A0ABY6Z788_9BACL|nr:hypothetical protein [Alicyclobacillus dauci]WAH38768.1 hypothetical protein NZD86_09955 [Alicyclobacillus dauci]